MSRAELASLVNAILYPDQQRRRRSPFNANYVGKLEDGIIHWPNAEYRAAMREVLAVGTDSELGFYDPKLKNIGTVEDASQHLSRDGSGRATVAALTGGHGSAADAPPMVAPPLDQLRLLIDELADRGDVDDQLNRLEAAVEIHAVAALSTPPGEMLDRLAMDIVDVHRVGRIATGRLARRTVTIVAAQLAAMVADEYTVVGDVAAAEHWYDSAIRAADATGHHALRCDVRALAAMLPLYHQGPLHASRQAETAYAAAGGVRCVGACRAAILNAVARSSAGDTGGALTALTAARREFDDLDDSHRAESVFGISSRRFLFYEGRVLLACEKYDHAMRTFDTAIDLYPDEVVGDTTLIRLDRAECLIRLGEVEAGTDGIVEAVQSVPAEHQVQLLARRAHHAINHVPRSASRLPAVRKAMEALADWMPPSSPSRVDPPTTTD